MNEDAPYVAIIAAEACPPGLIDEVLWGLEEDGVPARLLPSRGGSTGELAGLAAAASPLELGIALGAAGECAIGHAAVQRRCLLESEGPLTPAQARRAGCIAARLAKRLTLPLEDGTWKTP
ncbi:MAG TPA: glycerol dehydratase reactivase beta/small subunit family protein [Chloroflexota bacterium]|nr:glycerol dehydratase reactivase beta/small subunit family protein [Chloroflexota bacterium]